MPEPQGVKLIKKPQPHTMQRLGEMDFEQDRETMHYYWFEAQIKEG